MDDWREDMELEFPSVKHQFQLCGQSYDEPGLANRQSEIENGSHTLALTPNQDSGHSLNRTPCFGECGVWPVPAGVIGVMSCRSALAMVALSTTGAVQHRFMRACLPVLVNVELDYIRAG